MISSLEPSTSLGSATLSQLAIIRRVKILVLNALSVDKKVETKMKTQP